MGFVPRSSPAFEVPAEGVMTYQKLHDLIDASRKALKKAWVDPDALHRDVDTTRANDQRLILNGSPYMAATPALVKRIQHLLWFHTTDLEEADVVDAPHLHIAEGTDVPVDPVHAPHPHGTPAATDAAVA